MNDVPYCNVTVFLNVFFCVVLQPTEVPAGEPDSADGGDEVEQHPSSSASVVMSEGKKRKRPKTQMHEALMEFLERPRESDMISKQVIFKTVYLCDILM